MSCRVNSAEVREIMDTAVNGDLTPFITPANLIVTRFLTDQGYTDEHLKEIERWLSAHFLAIRDPRVRSRSIGDAKDTYAISGGFTGGLDATPYGQQVLTLDFNGVLKRTVGKSSAFILAVPESY